MDRDFQAVFAAIGGFFVVTLLLAAAILFYQHRKITKSQIRRSSSQIQSRPLRNTNPSTSLSIVDASWSWDPNLKISMEELSRATGNFSLRLIAGDGSFGLVYKARHSIGVVVTVKKLSPDAFQGFREFAAEMETLSKLRHRNIVKILGYWASSLENNV